MKIALCGPHGSGKTTLLQDLKESNALSNVTFLPEITRLIKAKGYSINEHGANETQLLVLSAHIQNLLYEKNFIVDRCLVDGYVYTHYLYEKNLVSKEVDDFAAFLLKTYISKYEYIFYIPAEFQLVDDKTRSQDLEFYEKVKELFKITIEDLRDCAKITTITGSREQRVNKIKEILNGER